MKGPLRVAAVEPLVVPLEVPLKVEVSLHSRDLVGDTNARAIGRLSRMTIGSRAIRGTGAIRRRVSAVRLGRFYKLCRRGSVWALRRTRKSHGSSK